MTSRATGPGAAFEELPAPLLAELEDAGLDPREVHEAVLRAVAEDLPGDGVDVTTAATVPAELSGTAEFGARAGGVVAGLAVAELVFAVVVGPDAVVRDRLPDGTVVDPGRVVLRVHGPVGGLLTAERTALNFAGHLSGVATATARWVAALEGTRAQVLDTRKTLPGWRSLEKYAVRCGGGVNHRHSLSDMALVKDNHVLAAGGVVPAYRAVCAQFPGVPVEVEVTTLEQLRDLLDAGAGRILLDNMDCATMAAAVRLNDARGDRRALLEASGGLTFERAAEVAATGVDFISVGALTHSVKVFDIGMDLVPHPQGPR